MPTLPPDSIHPKSRTEWRRWLEENHTRPDDVWLISWKKATCKPRFEDGEALCFGWVDSKPGKLDEERTMLWFAPRGAKTGWSKPNKERVERLIKAARMAPIGSGKDTFQN